MVVGVTDDYGRDRIVWRRLEQSKDAARRAAPRRAVPVIATRMEDGAFPPDWPTAVDESL